MTGVEGFVNGMTAFLRGTRLLIDHPRLCLALVLPVVVNTLLYAGLVYLAITHAGGWIDQFFDDRTEWYWTWTGARYVSWLVSISLIAVLSFFSFVPVGALLTAPFSDLASQRVEDILLPGESPAYGGVGGIVHVWALAAWHAVIRFGFLVALYPILFVLQFVPLLGQAAAILMSGLLIFVLSWEGLEYSMARRRLGLRAKLRCLEQHRARTLGLGAGAFLLLLIPFTALFVFPLLAVSGTVLYCEIQQESEDG